MSMKNVPNILSTITTSFAKDNINIENMVNQSKGDMAYTILDVNECDSAALTAHLAELDGVIRTRII